MSFTRLSSTAPADLAFLLNRLGDEITADIGTAGDTALWGQIGNKPTTFPPAPHSHAWSAIAGKPSTFPPAAHTHAVAEVNGLDSRLDAVEYFSGPRNITGLLSTAPTSGALYLERIGSTVWLEPYRLIFPESVSIISTGSLLTAGFLPRRIHEFDAMEYGNQPESAHFTVHFNGDMHIHNVIAGQQIRGVLSWPTSNSTPAPGTEPGAPA